MFRGINRAVVHPNMTHKLRNNRVSDMLVRLEVLLGNKNWACNDDTQLGIENFCFDQFDRLGEKESYLNNNWGGGALFKPR